MADLPLIRKFIPLASSSASHRLLFSCRILQFNLLADGLSGLREDLGAFSRIRKEDIVWEHRKSMLLNEILQYDPDIITVQECDHYDDFLEPLLAQRGYAGVFAVKPNSPCLEVSDRGDGCAVFVKTSKFMMTHSEVLRYTISAKDLRASLALASGSDVPLDTDPSVDDDVTVQNQVAIIVRCDLVTEGEEEGRGSGVPLVIGTTHLKATKTGEGEAVRACEVKQMLSRVEKYVADLNQPCALLLTGDLNACPPSQRGSFRSVAVELIRGHSLKLRSVYNDDLVEALLKERGSEVTEESRDETERADIWSTWKGRVKEGEDGSRGERLVKQCIDYILYQAPSSGAAGGEPGAVPRGVLALYDNEYMSQTNYLPSAVYPSDHIAIAADFDFVTAGASN